MADDQAQSKLLARLTVDTSQVIAGLQEVSDAFKRVQEQMSQRSGTEYLANADGTLTNLTRLTQQAELAQQRLVSAQDLSEKKMEILQQQSDARIERENERHLVKMQQDAELAQARIQKTLTQREPSPSIYSSSFSGRAMSDIQYSAIGMASGMVIFKIIDALTSLPVVALQAQQSMVKLQQVLELSPSPQDIQRFGSLNGMLQQLQQTAGVLSQVYGVDLNTVIDAMSMVGRKYKDVGDIITLTDAAMQLYAVDSVPVADAVTGLESLTSQYGLSVGQARQAMFQITAASHEFQVTASDLVDAISRSGSAFNTMHMNTAQSIAAIATLAQITSQSGSTIGNAWKSIENSLGSDKSVKALKDLGVAVYDSNGNLRDSVTILEQLQSKWPELSDEAKIHFATVLAGGKYQYSRLLAFLDDYSGQYQRALKGIEAANEQMQEKLVSTAMESPTKQLQMTQASLQVLSNTIMQNVTPSLISFLTDVRQGTGYINDHWQSIQTWIGTGAKLAEAYIGWKFGLAAYQAIVDSTWFSQLRLNAAILGSVNENLGFSAAMGTMGDALLGLGAKAAIVTARFAALFAIFQSVTAAISRGTDPADAKIKDIQAKLDTLNHLSAEQGHQTVGQSVTSHLQDAAGLAYLYFKDGGDLARMNKDAQFLSQNRYDNPQALAAQRKVLEKQLTDAQAAKDHAQAAEIEKSLAEVNRMVDAAMKHAMNNVPKSRSTTGGTSPGMRTPSTTRGSGSKPPTPQQAFTNGISSGVATDNAALTSYKAQIDALQPSLQLYNDQMRLSAQQLSQNMNNHRALSAYVSGYRGEQESLNKSISVYADENAKINAMLLDVQRRIANVNSEYEHGRISTKEHTSALNALDGELSKLSAAYKTNQDQLINQRYNVLSLVDAFKQEQSTIMNAQFAAQQKVDTDAVSDRTKVVQTDTRVVSDWSKQLNVATSLLSKHRDSMRDADETLSAFHRDVNALTQSNRDLDAENVAMTRSVRDLRTEIATATTAYKDGRITYDDYTSKVEDAQSKIDNLTQSINQNTDAVSNNNDTISNAHQTIMSQIIDDLKTTYTYEQQIQNTELKNTWDAKIDALTTERDLYQQQLDALNQQFQIQSAQNQLATDQADLASIMADRRFQIVNPDGTLSWTYDTAKAADMQKKIADEQTKISQDAQKQALQDKIKADDAMIKQDQDTYNTQKANLDSYWQSVLSDPNLTDLADKMVAQMGLDGALKSVTLWAGKVAAQFASIQQSAISAGQATAQALGVSNPTPPSTSTSSSSSSTPSTPTSSTGGRTIETVIGPGGMGIVMRAMPFARGGMVPTNIGMPGVDSVPALLSSGEVISPSFDDLMSHIKPASSGTVNNFNVERIELPNVKDGDAETFLRELTASVRTLR